MCLLVRLVGKRATSKSFALSPGIGEKYAGAGAAELGSAGHGHRAVVGAAAGAFDGSAADGSLLPIGTPCPIAYISYRINMLRRGAPGFPTTPRRRPPHVSSRRNPR